MKTDIPKQYKALNKEKVSDLFDAAEWLYAITTELGDSAYEATDGDITITIKKATPKETQDYEKILAEAK